MIGKTALVTGANGGLGTYVTKALLEAGFAVVGLSPRIQRSDFDHPNFSAFHILRAVIPHMRKAVTGRIIAIGSRAAESPGPSVGAYSASKAALVSLVRTVAL